jgi:predicted DNA-binding protein
MSDNKIVVTKEQIEKAMACETAEELMALAKEVGIELTKEEAEAYMAELEDFELDGDTLKRVAGGGCYLESTKPSPKVQDILKSTTAILMFN